MNIEQKAATYDHNSASPADRNVFRTWMICHNLDITATLQFDKPSFLSSSASPRRRPWPGNTGDGSLESVVGTLTIPLEHISFHLRQQSFQWRAPGADLVPGLQRSGEHAASTFIIDQGVVEAMADATQRVKASPSTGDNAASQRFWLHQADISTKYSRLLLLSRYSSMHKVIQDSDLRSRMLDWAVSILQSYIDTAGDFDYSRYAPGCFFTYGVLAAGVVFKLSSDGDTTRVTSLLDQFSTILQRSPAVAGDKNGQGLFVRLTARFRAGGMSEPGPGNVSMITNGFPAWWKLYL
ncbi:hypothetical protein FRC08_014028 [Ceratobasidium sp. 394]|nr:hypothetical protein FRC08_014028 [Ceratobasidium sp. 394]